MHSYCSLAGAVLDVGHYNQMFATQLGCGRRVDGTSHLKLYDSLGLEANAHTYALLIEAYCRSAQVDRAKFVLCANSS